MAGQPGRRDGSHPGCAGLTVQLSAACGTAPRLALPRHPPPSQGLVGPGTSGEFDTLSAAPAQGNNRRALEKLCGMTPQQGPAAGLLRALDLREREQIWCSQGGTAPPPWGAGGMLCCSLLLGTISICIASASKGGSGSEERELGTTGSPGEEAAATLAASADGRGDTAEEEDLEEEEDDTEEDEVQVIDMKKENSEASCLKQQDSGKEASSPTSPGCNSSAEKPGEQPSLGKKNDISRHSYSRYNTISYRRIRKGNTKQRIDEFESMMHL
ncbi:ermin isoform X1 [Cuculus canorus]|uniref:ermin isoform X1 n=1 Tax=Cuculus canorus TaxID=55661 RepID=UPI0023AB0743|nr:ermin isoform X1 [Cuculus canorus]